MGTLYQRPGTGDKDDPKVDPNAGGGGGRPLTPSASPAPAPAATPGRAKSLTGTSTVTGGYTDKDTGKKTEAKLNIEEDLGFFGGAGTAEEKQRELEQDFFGQESLTSQALPGLQEALGSPGSAEDFFAQYGTPQASAAEGIDPSLDEYYNFARQQQAADINDQLAARGGFGSSAGIGMLGQSLAELGAEQANKRADFAMERAGLLDQTRLQGLEVGGGLARTAQELQQKRDVSFFEASDLAEQSEFDRAQEEFRQAEAAQAAAQSRADAEWMREKDISGAVGDVIQADIDAAAGSAVSSLGIDAAILKNAIRQSNVAPEAVADLISAAGSIAELASALGVPESSLYTSEQQASTESANRVEAKSEELQAAAVDRGPNI